MVYGSTYGQTEKVTLRIAGILRGAGHEVDVYRGDRVPEPVSFKEYDGCLVAASVIVGRHQGYVREFAHRHARELNALPSAFISVCGAAGDSPREAQRYLDSFRREAGWQPRLVHSFTGAVAYTRYAWWFRWYLKSISRRKGLPTDTSRDWDFTEWDEVDRFAGEFSRTLESARSRPNSPARV
jgi:menaquinone-dependent protoporphyrinogen oxidase